MSRRDTWTVKPRGGDVKPSTMTKTKTHCHECATELIGKSVKPGESALPHAVKIGNNGRVVRSTRGLS